MAQELAPKAPRKRARIVRWAVLSAVLVTVTVLGYLHQVVGIGKPAGVDALCPFGGLETLYALFSSGTLVKQIAMSSVVLLLATLVVALVFRRSFCGQICPLGFLQELFGGIGRRVFGRRFALPGWLDRPARYLKYVVLAVLIYLTWTTVSLVVRPYDPWVAYQHLTSAEVFTDFGIGLAILGISLVGSLLYDRFFCKYLCPMGATLGLISRLSVFKVRRSEATCIDCKACDTACPVNLRVSETAVVNSPECINCNECVAACPVKDTLTVSSRSGNVLSPIAVTGAVVALFGLVVAIGTFTGNFDWQVPSLATEAAQNAATSGAPAEAFDVTLIKGRTTLTEVTDATGIPAQTIEQVFGVPANEQSKAIKDTKDVYGYSPGDVRTFIELYRDDPVAALAFIPTGAEE
ncbi:MAG: 4Fe-4S binding protein [Actinomycetota bacterium]|nr:MAG: 4Fe-4S [Actinomycetota bacterium]MDP3630100.1 4Fe-4S binding protein [Actinomycetota bacterium]